MRFIIGFFLLTISLSLSYISSGVEHYIMYKINKEWITTPLFVYFIGYCIILFIIFRIRFKTANIFKIYLLRKLIKLNRIFHSKVYNEKVELNSLQEKSIKMWQKLLKDNSSNLDHCSESGRRIIKRDSLTCILKSTIQESNLIIIQNNGTKLFYDIFIPQKNSTEMSNLFDETQRKRIDLMIEKEKKSIEDALNSF